MSIDSQSLGRHDVHLPRSLWNRVSKDEGTFRFGFDLVYVAAAIGFSRGVRRPRLTKAGADSYTVPLREIHNIEWKMIDTIAFLDASSGSDYWDDTDIGSDPDAVLNAEYATQRVRLFAEYVAAGCEVLEEALETRSGGYAPEAVWELCGGPEYDTPEAEDPSLI